jgi:hypothetical protein
VAVLPQGRALHGEGHRGAGVGAVEGDLMLHGGMVSCLRAMGVRVGASAKTMRG